MAAATKDLRVYKGEETMNLIIINVAKKVTGIRNQERSRRSSQTSRSILKNKDSIRGETEYKFQKSKNIIYILNFKHS